MNTNFESLFAFGDKVTLDFHAAGTVTDCTVIKVHFTDRKVSYDVDITSTYKDSVEKFSTRLYNIDSCFVK